MRLVCISDTHKKHHEVSIPEGDVLIFAGDACGGGSEKSFRRFIYWFDSHDISHKIIVAGNHDCCMERFPSRLDLISEMKDLGIIYLDHSSCEIEGVRFFGSPYTPEFCNWAFNVPRGKRLETLWNEIPNDTEVLITHGPPMNILDVTPGEEHCGCQDLMNRVQNLEHLKFHIFGHIHDAYGVFFSRGQTFINCSQCDEMYNITNHPTVVDLELFK